MNAPSLLLFDLGGVLIESSVFEMLNRLLPTPVTSHRLKQRWLSCPLVRQFESGKISAQDFAERFVIEWGLLLTAEEFLEEFASWPRDFFPGACEMIQNLRMNYKVGCLSNSNSVHSQRFGDFCNEFDVTLFSHLLGVLKPDPEIFILAMDHCQVSPSEVCFFDDCQENVNTATSLGITAFCVDGFNSLLEILRTHKLLC